MNDRMFYLSGPMSGIPNDNIPEFTRIAVELREMGLEVVVPHELTAHMLTIASTPYESKKIWQECIRVDLQGMMRGCTDIVLMPGWYTSQGAVLELTVARALGFKAWFYKPYLPGDCGGQLIPMDRESYQ